MRRKQFYGSGDIRMLGESILLTSGPSSMNRGSNENPRAGTTLSFSIIAQYSGSADSTDVDVGRLANCHAGGKEKHYERSLDVTDSQIKHYCWQGNSSVDMIGEMPAINRADQSGSPPRIVLAPARPPAFL